MACLIIVAEEFVFIQIHNCYFTTLVSSGHKSRDKYPSTFHYVWENESSYLNTVALSSITSNHCFCKSKGILYKKCIVLLADSTEC